MSPILTKGEISVIQNALRKEIDILMKNKVSSANIRKVADILELVLKVEHMG